MTNQSPQPELYTVSTPVLVPAHGAIPAGELGPGEDMAIVLNTPPGVQIRHNMNAGEELRIYGVHVQYLTPSIPPTQNVQARIFIGNNSIPTNWFDTDWINANNDRTFVFSSPILCLASQYLYLDIRNTDPIDTAAVIITLSGEISISQRKPTA